MCVTGQCVSFLTAHEEAVHGLCWVPNNSSNVLISGDEKGVLIAHDIRTRSPLWNYTIPFIGSSTDASKVHGICCLHKHVYNNKTLMSAGCTQGYLSLFELENSSFKMSHKSTKSIARDDVRGCAILPYTTLDNSLICTTSFDKSANIYALHGQEIWKNIHSLQSNPLPSTNINNCITYHTDKILHCIVHTTTEDIITTGADGNVLLWSAK